MKAETIYKGKNLLSRIRYCEQIDADLKTIRSKDWTTSNNEIRVQLSTCIVGEIPEPMVLLKGTEINDIVNYPINRNSEKLAALNDELEQL